MGDANSYIALWNYWFFPALFMMLITLEINFLGDSLRDAFDPRSIRSLQRFRLGISRGGLQNVSLLSRTLSGKGHSAAWTTQSS